MREYPIAVLCKEEWSQKMAAMHMYSAQAEDEAVPVLHELIDLLTRLRSRPLQETIAIDHHEYFFKDIIPGVCRNIIRSKYFKNESVSALSNEILLNSVMLVSQYINICDQIPGFVDVFHIVFSGDDYYRNNNQMNDAFICDVLRNYGFLFELKPYSTEWTEALKAEDFIDVLKIANFRGKVSWSRGTIVSTSAQKLEIQFLYGRESSNVVYTRNSIEIAPYESMSKSFQWRYNLKAGDVIDCEDSFGGWYGSTIVEIYQHDTYRTAKIMFKFYDPSGSKYDEKGQYFGFAEYNEILDLTSPKIQPFRTMVKIRNQENGKTALEAGDINDMEFEYYRGGRVYALPRRLYCSEFLFKTLNQFGKSGGFSIFMNKLDREINFNLLCAFMKAMGGVAPYLHKSLVIQLLNWCKPVIDRHLFGEEQACHKDFNKERSELIFTGLRSLQRRLYTLDQVYEKENERKMRLVDKCLQSEALKKKLQGLNELKDIVRSVMHYPSRSRTIVICFSTQKSWVKSGRIFEKVYMTNSHVQLVKKSQEFFRFLISDNILEVGDLERVYKLAQKGDYQSRISLYKLFQEVSCSFKKEHVNYLIDTILTSDPKLILNQDIDLLHEMSKFSSYFPCEKAIKFFEDIIFQESSQLRDYATKKYAQIVAKACEMRVVRKQVIHSFIKKLSEPQFKLSQVCRVLKGIFQGIGVGQWGKKDLNDILCEQLIDEAVVVALKMAKGSVDWRDTVEQLLGLLLFLYKISYRMKVSLKILRQIWVQVSVDPAMRQYYYKWGNEVAYCEQGIEQSVPEADFQLFYGELFTEDVVRCMGLNEFNLARNLFLQINKRARFIVIPIVYKDCEKQYRRKLGMRHLKLRDAPLSLVYGPQNQDVLEQAMDFFMRLYNGNTNSPEQIDEFQDYLLARLSVDYKQRKYENISRTMRLLHILIDESQKKVEAKVQSLNSREKCQKMELIIINDLSYLIDYNKKSTLIVTASTTLMQLRKLLGKKYSYEWDEIKIVGRKLYPEHMNSRTLFQLGICENRTITISKKFQVVTYDSDILIGNDVNPKAMRVFKIIFDSYSTNGKMDREQCHSFTAACLNDNYRRHDDRVSKFFSSYDDDRDGFLTFDNFVAFLKTGAKEKESIVWLNLRNLGVNSDFKFKNQVDERQEIKQLPREKLAENALFYQILFQLLRVKELCEMSFSLLQRLPVCERVYRDVLGVVGDGSEEDQMNRIDLDKIFCLQEKYLLLYTLKIISLLSVGDNEHEKRWLKSFVKKGGFQRIERSLRHYYSKYLQISGVEINLVNGCIQLLFYILMQCFANDSNLVAVMIFEDERTVEEKIDCITLGVGKKKIDIMSFIAPREFTWSGVPRTQILAGLVEFLKDIWIHFPQYSKKNQVILQVAHKVATTVCFLLVNQPECHHFIQAIPVLFSRAPTPELSSVMYILVLSVCFNSQTHQKLYISELFKHITMPNITSEYFRILAALVARFGLEEERVSELPEILLRNILTEKNQLTIQGCAKLLVNFNLKEVMTVKEIQGIWNRCLFGVVEHACKKQGTRSALFQLLIKVCVGSEQLALKVIDLLISTFSARFKGIKINYSTEVNSRALNGFAGMKNLGNICYMNSMMQQLFTNKTFRYLLMRVDDKKEPVWVTDCKNNRVDDNLLRQTQRIFGYLEHTTRLDMIPSGFCAAYKPFGSSVNVMIQQDVQQFVSMFFDQLEAGIKDHPLRRAIDTFYTGKSTNLFQCHQCKKVKKVEETFYSLSLEVKNSKNLNQSFNRFNSGELINQYKCDFCEKKADVSKNTRISQAPKILTLHLQRIVFNLDTFINEKISTKHEFPMRFNLHPYTLQYYEGDRKGDEYEYELSGIICHIGNAEMGHYISYIKTENDKWQQFNDSTVSGFNPVNIASECFGGSCTYDDDYEWERKENSKSAYLLIYKKIQQDHLQIVVKSEEEKNVYIQQLNLEEINEKHRKLSILKDNGVKDSKKVVDQKSEVEVDQKNEVEVDEKNEVEETTELQESSKSEDGILKESRERQMKQEVEEERERGGIQQERVHEGRGEQERVEQERVRQGRLEQHQVHQVHQPIEDVKKKKSQGKVDSEGKQLVVGINSALRPFINAELLAQIVLDNEIHFFEKCISSNIFVRFVSKLLLIEHGYSKDLLLLVRQLSFGFWLKNIQFKQLLESMNYYIGLHPFDGTSVLSDYENMFQLMIENAETEVRSNMVVFLVNAISQFIASHGLSLKEEDTREENVFIMRILEYLLGLLGGVVTKCWTKFSQYFQFWYEFSKKGCIQINYMRRVSIIKHFVDYYLDKKSPFKLYIKRANPIGSTYANPNFTNLLKTVLMILKNLLKQGKQEKDTLNEENVCSSMSKDEELLVYNFDFMEKMIIDNYEIIAADIVEVICPSNMQASEKVAVVLLKGLPLCNCNNVQPYLDVARAFLLIKDDFQIIRLKWILGRPCLSVGVHEKVLFAPIASSLEERIYNFPSSYQIQHGNSLLQPLFQCNRESENYCMLTLQFILLMCQSDSKIKEFMLQLPAPSYIYCRYISFFEQFINRYITGVKSRLHFHSSTIFDQEQLGKNVKKLHGEVFSKEESDEQKYEQKYEEHNVRFGEEQSKKNPFDDGEVYMEKPEWENLKLKEDSLKNNADSISQSVSQSIPESAPQSTPESVLDSAKRKINDKTEQSYETMELVHVRSEERYNLEDQNMLDSVQKKVSKESQQSYEMMEITHTRSEESTQNYRQNLTQFQERNNEQSKLMESIKIEEEEDIRRNQQGINEHTHVQVRVLPAPIQEEIIASSDGFSEGDTKENVVGPIYDKRDGRGYKNKQTPDRGKKVTKQQNQVTYHPMEFHYQPIQELETGVKDLMIRCHQSRLVLVPTFPTGYNNDSFGPRQLGKKLRDRLDQSAWDKRKQTMVSGFYVSNQSKQIIRLSTDQGTVVVQPNQTIWVWSKHILLVFAVKKTVDWPKWEIYGDGETDEGEEEMSPNEERSPKNKSDSQDYEYEM